MIGVFLPNSTTVNELFFNILTFILIIFTRDDAILSKILTNKIIIFLGSISFSFYLLHILVIEYLSFNNFFYSLIVSIAILFIWYFIFENYLYKKVKRVINESK
jgi:peptidoglycan/LPS O-acetylase OafA/YrhL